MVVNATLMESGSIGMSGVEVAASITVEDVADDDSNPSLSAISVGGMSTGGKRTVGGRVTGDIIIRQPEERPDRTTPVRAWTKDACIVVGMTGANSEPSRKGCFDVTDVICDHPRAYCMRLDDQCFAGSVRVPRGIKVTMYNLMADWKNVCESDKTIVVEESRTNRTGDITFWKYGFQDPRRRVCSFKFELLPGWSCDGAPENPRRHRERRKRVNANAHVDIRASSERHTTNASSPPNDDDPAVQDVHDAEPDKNSERKSAATVETSSDPNYYYNINGDVIYVPPVPPAGNTKPTHVDHAALANEIGSDVESENTDDTNSESTPERHTDNHQSVLSYQNAQRMPHSKQVPVYRGPHEDIRDDQAHVTSPQTRLQLVQSQHQLMKSKPQYVQTRPQIAQPPVQLRLQLVQASSSGDTGLRAEIANGTSQGSGSRGVVDGDGGKFSGGGGGATIVGAADFVSSRAASALQTDSSSSVPPAASLDTVEDPKVYDRMREAVRSLD
eukprot:TRINITY_DN7615_c0_g1_i2.p1 TRINITY_DN7615_c0_g1~~TRINITY_DN7615_c0_g1_i2.p1  ORF type:complete len:574 (+),score=71.69 TRINITY_DN7615_c0_g1_i2:220-1722(+)